MAAVATWLVAAACGAEGDGRAVVTVFAAASLSDVFGEMEMAIEEANPGIDVRLSFAGSSALREQILDGAPADVFASANEGVMRDLVGAGAAQSPVVFASNRLVIATPAGNPARVGGLPDFENDSPLFGACSPEVPCGSAAEHAFIAAGVNPSLDTEEPDVRRLLAKIVDGELDAGLVYATDAVAAGSSVDRIELPAGISTSTSYPIAVLTDSSVSAEAAIVVDFVLSEQGRSLLVEHGFGS